MKLYIFLISLFHTVLGYRPVAIVHGIMSEGQKLDDLKLLIENTHPGTNVTLINLYPDLKSFVPLQWQLDYWTQKIVPIMKVAVDGIHIICHSQGGLICQGMIEECDDHNVKTFVALSSPLMGQFGVPGVISQYFPLLQKEREALSRYMYTSLAQDTISISNYWRDPRPEYEQVYLEESKYLPIVHDNPTCSRRNDKDKERHRRKNNFLKLKKLVLIGGPDDGVIIPWQSSIFGFYDEDYNIVEMKNQTMYKDDWFGLRTLFERGDVTANSIRGVKHVDWHGNKGVFHDVIEPFLD